MLLMEISPEQSAAAIALVDQTGAFETSRVIKDASGNERVIAAARG
jgi:methylase of polypeptide subunit release factors